MAKIKFFNKEKVAGFIGEGLETGAKALDEADFFQNDGYFSIIPFSKLVSFIGNRIIMIADPNKAFIKAFSFAYYSTFGKALRMYNIDPESSEEALEKLKKGIPEEIKAEDFNLGDFGSNPLVFAYNRLYADFLEKCQVSALLLDKVMHYVSQYLELNFHLLLENSPITYKKYIDLISTESYKLFSKIKQKNRYESDLKNEFLMPVFQDETGMSLQDIYVEPGFRVHRYCLPGEHDKNDFYFREDRGFDELKAFTGSLHDIVYRLLRGEQVPGLKCNTAKIIFVLGYPGQGKSSFCKKTLFDLFSDKRIPGKNVFFSSLSESFNPLSF